MWAQKGQKEHLLLGKGFDLDQCLLRSVNRSDTAKSG